MGASGWTSEGVGSAFTRGVPHCEQNRASSGFARPHEVQKGIDHSFNKLRSGLRRTLKQPLRLMVCLEPTSSGLARSLDFLRAPLLETTRRAPRRGYSASVAS